MYFTDRGIEELVDRRGRESVTIGWLAERLRDFVDLNPEFETPIERFATWVARLDEDELDDEELADDEDADDESADNEDGDADHDADGDDADDSDAERRGDRDEDDEAGDREPEGRLVDDGDVD